MSRVSTTIGKPSPHSIADIPPAPPNPPAPRIYVREADTHTSTLKLSSLDAVIRKFENRTCRVTLAQTSFSSRIQIGAGEWNGDAHLQLQPLCLRMPELQLQLLASLRTARFGHQPRRVTRPGSGRRIAITCPVLLVLAGESHFLEGLCLLRFHQASDAAPSPVRR